MIRKTNFFEGCCWLKFNNLGLALGMALKFYTSVTKRLKLKVRKFLGLIPTFVKVSGEKLVKGAFCLPHPPILNRVNTAFRELQITASKLFTYFNNNLMKGKPKKSHLLFSSKTPKNDYFYEALVESSSTENCLEFRLIICNKVGKKINVLSRLVMSFDNRRMVMKAFIESQFNYCPLIRCFIQQH